MQKTMRIFTVGIVFSLCFGNFPLIAADPARSAGTETPAPGVPAPAKAPGTKDPLIEVSVDSLEISESNSNKLGAIWGDTAGDNQLNFIERSIPSIFAFDHLNRANLIKAQLDALIKNNQARILANPTLLTKSGFEASFLVGGEIPYQTVGQGGVGGVEFKKYGVSLKILPQITARDTIEAQINVSVTNPDNSVAITPIGSSSSTPGLSSREAGSKVEVRDGETVVLAGIKQSRREKTVIRVPILSAIPLLGLLFRHTEENVVQTSLVLFVTFRLVK